MEDTLKLEKKMGVTYEGTNYSWPHTVENLR